MIYLIFLPKSEYGEDDRVLTDSTEDAEDTGHDVLVDSVESRGSSWGCIGPEKVKKSKWDPFLIMYNFSQQLVKFWVDNVLYRGGWKHQKKSKSAVRIG